MLRVLVILAIVLIVAYFVRQRLRARRANVIDPTISQRQLLDAEVRLWRRLPAPLKERLLPRIEEFLQRVPFEGAHGFEVTEAMRVTIAAQACIVTLGADDYPFDALHGVTVHPDEFLVEERDEDEETGVVTEGYRALSGQAQGSDRIVLSWRDVADAETREDGYNVVIHEFTHFLEHSHPGGDPAAHAALESAHAALCDAVDRGEPTLLDPYGAEDLTEFLAVAAEFFFELPRELRARHPTLYVLLRDSFKLDPASWDELAPPAP